MKTALILGATSDMAEAIAYRWAKEGFNLILAARNAQRLAPLKSDLEIKHAVQVNLEEFDAVDFNSHHIFYQSLSNKPDIVFCVFGFLGNHESAKVDFNEAHRIINSNYTGAVSILNIVAEDMEKRQSGTIVGISSVAGDRGRADNYYYGSAKAGFTAYLAGLRGRMFQSNVHVLTVKPGFAATQMTKSLDLPKPITAQPSQIANDVFKAVQSKKNTIYTLWMWRYIMLIITHIPEFIFKKIKFGHGKVAE